MPDMTLKRVYEDEDGTFGVLLAPRGPFAVTLELPWRNNEVRKSRIPAGVYTCRRIISPNHGETFTLENVPGRSLIRIHKANTKADLLGCIGVGESFDPINGVDGISQSAKGFEEFMRMQKGVNTFRLTILDVADEMKAAA
jgi:hypothetical protein